MRLEPIYKTIKQSQKHYLQHLRTRLTMRVKKAMRSSFTQGFLEKQQSFNSFSNNTEDILQNTNKMKFNLIIEIAKNLIDEEISSNKNLIINMTIKVLKNIAEHTDVEIIAHHQDAIVLEDSLANIMVACSITRKVIIKPDNNLTRGSLIVKANKSIIDAQIKTQLNGALELLLRHKNDS